MHVRVYQFYDMFQTKEVISYIIKKIPLQNFVINITLLTFDVQLVQAEDFALLIYIRNELHLLSKLAKPTKVENFEFFNFVRRNVT